MSWLFLGSQPTLPLLATLMPIVGGVALASFSVRDGLYLYMCMMMSSSAPDVCGSATRLAGAVLQLEWIHGSHGVQCHLPGTHMHRFWCEALSAL